ncbi:DUF2059 domain-containing protein [Terriglobus saanensis]|nr:DUF2059 domain-containing protein [Terriglobus saanensis]
MRRFLPLALVLTAACATVEAQTAPSAAKPVVAAPAPAAAPITPAKRAKAEQLLVLLKLDSGLQTMLTNTGRRIHSLAQEQAAQAGKTPEQQKLATDYTAKIDAMTTSALDYAKLRQPLADVYASNFTDSELDSIIAFYGSPAGKVFVDKTQAVGEQTNALFQGVLKDLQPKLGETTKEFQTSLKAATPPTISTPENMKDTPAPPAAPKK